MPHMPAPLRDWYMSSVTVDIASALLEADEPVRTDAVADALDQPERSIRNLMDRLHAGRLVSRVSQETGKPGRRPWIYWLGEEQRPGAQRAVNTPPELWSSHRLGHGDVDDDDLSEKESLPLQNRESTDAVGLDQRGSVTDAAAKTTAVGRLVRGQELVLVDVSGTAMSDLLAALPGTRTATPASWIARIGDEIAFAFEPDSGDDAAADLLAVLAGARLSVRLAPVAHVATIDDLLDQARRLAPEIRRARSERDAHDATR